MLGPLPGSEKKFSKNSRVARSSATFLILPIWDINGLILQSMKAIAEKLNPAVVHKAVTLVMWVASVAVDRRRESWFAHRTIPAPCCALRVLVTVDCDRVAIPTPWAVEGIVVLRDLVEFGTHFIILSS